MWILSLLYGLGFLGVRKKKTAGKWLAYLRHPDIE